MKSKRLIPPDLKRCQAEVPGHSFMTFGGRAGRTQCKNVPVLVVYEVKDKRKGKMSLCKYCLLKYIDQCA